MTAVSVLFNIELPLSWPTERSPTRFCSLLFEQTIQV